MDVTRPDAASDAAPEDHEPPELDLTPRTGAPAGGTLATRRRRNRRLGVVGLLVVLAAVAGFLVTQLNSATTYFYTVDQAVAKRDVTGGRTFRIEGTVADDPAKTASADGEKLTFTLANNGASARCEYTGGEPSALFKKGEPVVLEGHWDGAVFTSSLIMVKHDATYDQKHPDRVTTTTGVP